LFVHICITNHIFNAYNYKGDLIEFDFAQCEQQMYREMRKAALYINSRLTGPKRKSREEIESSARAIGYVAHWLMRVAIVVVLVRVVVLVVVVVFLFD
jgi:hypothetical protein